MNLSSKLAFKTFYFLLAASWLLAAALPCEAAYYTAFYLNASSYSCTEGGSISGTVYREAFFESGSSGDWNLAASANANIYISSSGQTYPITASDVTSGGSYNITIPAYSYSATASILQGQSGGFSFYNNNAHVGTPAVTVKYAVSGTASNGVDYTPRLTNAIVIPAGTYNIFTNITATFYTNAVGTKTVTVTVVTNFYALDASSPSATMGITPDTATISVTASSPYAFQPGGVGQFTLTRDGGLLRTLAGFPDADMGNKCQHAAGKPDFQRHHQHQSDAHQYIRHGKRGDLQRD